MEYEVLKESSRRRGKGGMTPLMLAVERGDLSAVRSLGDVDDVDDNGWTALHHAASLRPGRADIIKELVRRKANLEAKANSGRTLLHHATTSVAVRTLLDVGADRKTLDEKGDCLDMRVVCNSADADVLMLLKVDPNKSYDNGGSLLDQARTKEQVETLVRLGAKVRSSDVDPLRMALTYERGHEVVLALVDAGASVTYAKFNGDTPLHCAARHGASLESVQLLLECGADPEARNEKGERPYDLLPFTLWGSEIHRALKPPGGCVVM